MSVRTTEANYAVELGRYVRLANGGGWGWAPKRPVYSAHGLRVIARELDRKNRVEPCPEAEDVAP